MPAQFVIEQDTVISHIRFRLSKPHGLDLRLIGFILVSEILCLGLRQLPFWSVLMITFDSSRSNLLSNCRWLPDLKHCVPFFSTCCTSTCCFVKLNLLLALLFFVHGFSGPDPWLFCSRVLGSRSMAVLFTGSRVPVPGCFSFFTAIWHVFHPAYNSHPWSESKRCPRSLQTASLWTSHK